MSDSVTPIAAMIAAVATAASAIIYWRTLKSIKKQTKPLQRQFELAEAERKKRFDPVVVVQIGQIKRLSLDGDGTIVCVVQNFGSEPIRIWQLQLTFGVNIPT